MVPNFEVSNLTLLELLFLLISYAGMGLWSAFISDYVRNLVQGGDRLSPLAKQIGKWLAQRAPLQMQIIVIAVQALLPIVAYIVLAIWVDAALRDVEQVYRFLRDLSITIAVAKVYFLFAKGQPQTVNQYIIQRNVPDVPAPTGATGEPTLNVVGFNAPGAPPPGEGTGVVGSTAPLLPDMKAQGEAYPPGQIDRVSDAEIVRITNLIRSTVRSDIEEMLDKQRITPKDQGEETRQDPPMDLAA